MRRLRLASLLLVCLIFSLEGQSQNCSEIIPEAETLYEKGFFKDCISLLQKCTNTQDETLLWQKHRLLAMSYLLVDDQIKAEDAARSMLEIYPVYVPNEFDDPVSLIRLLKSITIIPKLSVGVACAIGTNLSLTNIRKSYSLREQNKTYTGNGGIQFGISVSYQFNEKIALDAGISGLVKRYSLDYSFDNWNLNMNERLNYLNFPIMFKYMPRSKHKIAPFVGMGLYGNFLISSFYDFSSEYKPSGYKNELNRISSLNTRESSDYGPMLVAGLTVKGRKGEGFAQVSFSQSMVNVGKGDDRYNFGNELLTSFYYLEDDFRLNNLALSFGYRFYFNYQVLSKR